MRWLWRQDLSSCVLRDGRRKGNVYDGALVKERRQRGANRETGLYRECLFDRFAEGSALGKSPPERECRLIEGAKNHVSILPAYLQMHAAGRKIDDRVSAGTRLVGAPNAVDRPARRKISVRWTKRECEERRILRTRSRETIG